MDRRVGVEGGVGRTWSLTQRSCLKEVQPGILGLGVLHDSDYEDDKTLERSSQAE